MRLPSFFHSSKNQPVTSLSFGLIIIEEFPQNMAGPLDEHRKGARTLSETLDRLATVQPNRVYASIPTSSTLTSGFRDVTVQQISHAVDACAWWLSDLLGKSDNFETLSYVGIADLGYTVFFYAAIKCGYKVCQNSGTGLGARMLTSWFRPSSSPAD